MPWCYFLGAKWACFSKYLTHWWQRKKAKWKMKIAGSNLGLDQIFSKYIWSMVDPANYLIVDFVNGK